MQRSSTFRQLKFSLSSPLIKCGRPRNRVKQKSTILNQLQSGDEAIPYIVDYEPMDLRFQRYAKLSMDKFKQLRTSFPTMLFALLGGFVVGNLFGNFGPGLKSKFIWDGFGLPMVNVVLEIISYLYYTRKGQLLRDRPGIRQYLNYLKLGFLYGIFTDAFKVGS
eukprot:TRINITY_DN2877_c0_g1_i1.p1 TRINITY_DN2877_c0_g1~~TRINITY_DN2877_c0_g1_i1.p1  ORF type:complete len:164 (-),score=3.58 TRINITY_DN2877_c0_g1_i1:161-652(-)